LAPACRMDIRQRVGANVKKWRKEKGLSQEGGDVTPTVEIRSAGIAG